MFCPSPTKGFLSVLGDILKYFTVDRASLSTEINKNKEDDVLGAITV